MKKPPVVNTVFIDKPELTETFADSIGTLSFDGQVMKLEFRTTRQAPITAPGTPPDHIQYPSCRLVLTPKASIELFTKLQAMIEQLEKVGVFKKLSLAPTDTSH